MAIDWSAARVPNFFAAMQEGYDAGRTHARQSRLDQGYARYAAGDKTAIADVMAADPSGGAALAGYDRQQRQQAAGDAIVSELAAGNTKGALSHAATPEQYATVSSMIATADDRQRDVIDRHNKTMAGILFSLKSAKDPVTGRPLTPAERLRVGQHIATSHADLGIKPEEITIEDVSDAAIDGHLAVAQQIKDLIAAHKSVAVAPGGSLVDPANPQTPLYTAPDRIPAGFERDASGNLRPIPGGPADTAYVHQRATAGHVTGGGHGGHGAAGATWGSGAASVNPAHKYR